MLDLTGLTRPDRSIIGYHADTAITPCPHMGPPAERVVAFYNQRGTAEQWIKEGKGAIK